MGPTSRAKWPSGSTKDLVESAPKPVKEAASKDEAAEIVKKIEATGAKAELK